MKRRRRAMGSPMSERVFNWYLWRQLMELEILHGSSM
jgi:hypothetical protein